jgi:methionyl-tRNA synthetase
MKNKKILVTTALYYANGDLHLGHVLEQIQADIWVRWQKLLGKECWFISGDDAHGTPMMLKAKEQNISPEQLIKIYYERHLQDIAAFSINYDNFYTTHSPENQQIVTDIYQKLFDRGDIEVREIQQLYDEQEKIFLPDRYVKGQCPRCGALDQYGDNCEVCGAHYATFELKNPKSILTNTVPVTKTSQHYFFTLNKYKDFLENWLQSGDKIQQSMLHKLQEWFKEDLRDWDISRDSPYFGFLIPGTQDKYFYVWLDAPIGYLSIFKNLCNKNSAINFTDFVAADSEEKSEIYHFIGKDIMYFHALFWPAMLQGANYRTPDKIFAHGFMTINGEKMSKSRGNFLTARQYYQHLSTEYLRYYLAAKLSDGVEDLDLNMNDFVARVNSDLVGKFVNIASRCAGFINKNFANKLSAKLDNPELYQQFIAKNQEITKLFIDLNYSKAIREIMSLADLANSYIDDQKPWKLIKDGSKTELVQQVCTTGINLFKVLITYLQPVIPQTALLAEKFLKTNLNLSDLEHPLVNHTISKFQPLISRIDMDTIDKMFKEAATESTATNKSSEPNDNGGQISIDDFAKIDLRIAKIINAEHVEGADKLLKLTLDVGELGEKQVFAGIKSAYNPEQLINKLTVMVANLKERKMRFGLSQGMVLAASSDDKQDLGIYILEPHSGAKPGMRVK